MKNFLWFLLGFSSVFAFFINCYAAGCSYNDTCYYTQYTFQYDTTASDYSSSVFDVENSQNCAPIFKQKGTNNTIKYPAKYILLTHHEWDIVSFAWKTTGYRYIKLQDSDYDSGISAIISRGGGTSSPFDIYPSGIQNCGQYDCADSDNDGLCDVCDDAPNDSTVGPTKYVRGYYELNDGTTVATIYSYSPTDKTNDLVTIDKKYNYPDKFPGLVYAVGMASYIDEKEFIKGGGRFAGLSKAEPVYTMKCNAVESSDQCSKAVCNITDGEPEILEKLEDVEENGEAQAYPTEQKAADAPYLDLDKTCDELRTKCNSSCGAATNVKSFGCSENKHMVCECLNNGTWEVADDWDELGVTIDQSETTTNNYYGEGDSTTGGGSVTGVSDDGTGGFTGSYEYVEGSYNYDSFGSHYSQLASKFPFSLRTTIGSIYSDFKGSGAAPVYYYTIYGHSVTIDLSSFDDIAKMIRSIFALGITLSTMIMLIYLYVGIDLRGK